MIRNTRLSEYQMENSDIRVSDYKNSIKYKWKVDSDILISDRLILILW